MALVPARLVAPPFDFKELVSNLESLPVELKLAIFGNLDANSLLAVRCSHGKMAEVAAAARKTVLFEKVLPLIFHRLEATDVLNCREVCRAWRNVVVATVGSLFDNGVFHPVGQVDRVPLDKFAWREFRYSSGMGDSAIQEKWMMHFEEQRRNFDVYLKQTEFATERATVQWCEGVLNFLKLYGHNILDLEIHANDFDVPTDYYLNFIADCLRATPNVKVLRLGADTFGMPRSHSIDFQFTVPALPQLNSLIVHTLCWQTNFIFEQICEQYGSSLSQLLLPVDGETMEKIITRCPQINDVTLYRVSEVEPAARKRIEGPTRRLKIVFKSRFSMVRRANVADTALLRLANVMNAHQLDLHYEGLLRIENMNHQWLYVSLHQLESFMVFTPRVHISMGMLKQLQAVTHLMMGGYNEFTMTTFAPDEMVRVAKSTIANLDLCKRGRRRLKKIFSNMESLERIDIERSKFDPAAIEFINRYDE